MVVISACETGRGALVHNEGVMSFARAFLYAGCPSTINALWKADDHSTAEIIRLFYKYLDRRRIKITALRNAKLEFLHQNPLYRDPAYWSHIILTGNSSALNKKNSLGLGCFGNQLRYDNIFQCQKKKEKKSTLFIVDIGYLKLRCLNLISVFRDTSTFDLEFHWIGWFLTDRILFFTANRFYGFQDLLVF
jgi:hypothetical protein